MAVAGNSLCTPLTWCLVMMLWEELDRLSVSSNRRWRFIAGGKTILLQHHASVQNFPCMCMLLTCNLKGESKGKRPFYDCASSLEGVDSGLRLVEFQVCGWSGYLKLFPVVISNFIIHRVVMTWMTDVYTTMIVICVLYVIPVVQARFCLSKLVCLQQMLIFLASGQS